MKKFLISLCIIGLSAFAVVPAVIASGVETAQNSQVGLVEKDGVMYLTTDVNGNPISPTPVAASEGAVFDSGIPQGFATNLPQLISFLLSTVMIIATLLVLFQLIMGAFDWITSGGDKGKTDRARQRIISAIIGIIIIAASLAIANLVVRFLGFSSFSDVFLHMKNIQGSPAPLITPVPATSSATPVIVP